MTHPFDIDENCLKQQTIDEFVRSITRIETAFANILDSEVEFLKRNKDQFSPKELSKFNENLEEIIKLAIKKEIILQLLLEEIKKCPEKCKREKSDNCHCKCCEEKKYYCEVCHKKRRCYCKRCREECVYCKDFNHHFHDEHDVCSYCKEQMFNCVCFKRDNRD